jgi:hypothetical protein
MDANFLQVTAEATNGKIKMVVTRAKSQSLGIAQNILQ